ncbi:ABC transporter permease [Paenibacillus crassostreae]|uniref:Nitrate transport permease nrtB n=1 Tax=Paenibacillus crassostreae TaxID=1763538 RepID=A0A167DTT6_9BACL|nr:ABC transporter permease [Paenibacillus crassostreae]AOZ91072.1 nitrate transport permease nrtB [Paenibacillus crassostreae]OAB74767.1 nitrate transport permease nrtB [Paenibacillus crassostreae]
MNNSGAFRSLFRIRKEINNRVFNTVMITTFALLILTWYLVSNFSGINSIFLPTPQATFKYLWSGLSNGSLWSDILISCYRVLSGFAIAIIIGTPLGLLSGAFKIVNAVTKPLIEFFRYLPISALIPLIMVWAGVGEQAKITIIVVGAVFSMTAMITDIVKGIQIDLINTAYTLGATQGQVIKNVIVPAIMPNMMDTMRMVMGWSWTYLIMAEMLASSSGLGYNIMIAERFMKTYIIFGGIFIIGILGLLFDRMFAIINKVLFHWAEDN